MKIHLVMSIITGAALICGCVTINATPKYSSSSDDLNMPHVAPDNHKTILPHPRPNVILITISSLRADHVGLFGYHRDTTPRLDAFGRENILFTNAFAASGWMMPAYGSIFTSLYPHEHGATHIDLKLHHQNLTLAEILKQNGYYCAGFCCNPRLDQNHGFAQGFDFYDDYSVSLTLQTLSPPS